MAEDKRKTWQFRLRRSRVRARAFVRRLLSPATRAFALLVVGDALLVYGVWLVAVPAGLVVAGASLLVYGLLFVDVDAVPRGRT
jgi:CHASE2 domain-containing sensor protein